MPKCAEYQPRPGLEEQCKVAVVRIISNCGNCSKFNWVRGKCDGAQIPRTKD